MFSNVLSLVQIKMKLHDYFLPDIVLSILTMCPMVVFLFLVSSNIKNYFISFASVTSQQGTVEIEMKLNTYHCML